MAQAMMVGALAMAVPNHRKLAIGAGLKTKQNKKSTLQRPARSV